MPDLKHKLNNIKEKLTGEANEAAGKATNNQELELKGKIQSSTADMKKKAGGIKEDIAGKINDKIDEMKEKNKDK